jgi:hypothetical protein
VCVSINACDNDEREKKTSGCDKIVLNEAYR